MPDITVNLIGMDKLQPRSRADWKKEKDEHMAGTLLWSS